MTMSHGYRHDASSEVQISATFVVVEPLHVTLMEKKRLLVNVMNRWWHVDAFQLLDLRERRTLKLYLTLKKQLSKTR